MNENVISKIIVDASLCVHRSLGPGLLEISISVRLILCLDGIGVHSFRIAVSGEIYAWRDIQISV